jgi:osmotically-inducible protein OsmY
VLVTGIMVAAVLSGCAVAMLGGAARSGGGSGGAASAPAGNGTSSASRPASGGASSGPASTAGKSAPQPGDSSISTVVRSRLSANPTLKALKIGVDTHDGIVTLTGQVNTLADKSAAQAEARAVGGVKAVNNQLTVR